MLGQNVLSRAGDKRADETYQDAKAALHGGQQIQAHLQIQDDALDTLLDKLARLEAAQTAGLTVDDGASQSMLRRLIARGTP